VFYKDRNFKNLKIFFDALMKSQKALLIKNAKPEDFA